MGSKLGRPFVGVVLACAHCGRDTRRKRCQMSTGKTGPLAGTVFCNRACQKEYFRGHIGCSWPGCSAVRLVEARNFRIKEARGWLCEPHTDHMEQMTGSRKITARKLEFMRGGLLDHNRLTWSFLKFFIHHRDGGICRTCATSLDFVKRPIEFHIDHILPVWQGGLTSTQNLQLLCIPCHKKKSAEEQKLVNQTRWKHRAGARFNRMTHTEKDVLISGLLAKIRQLEGTPHEEAPVGVDGGIPGAG